MSASSYRVPGPDYLVAGRYRLRSKIGGGGMGAVWLAHDTLLDRQVAIKQVLSVAGMTEDSAAEMRQRAMREGRIAARLSHRNAIAMHDVALDAGEPWLVMEYLPSRSIAEILHQAGTMPVKQVAQIGAQVADAMAEAHNAGIMHRDIKPGNILIAEGRNAGLVKLTDFGISRSKDDVQLTQTGVITGTPAYFAPEVARGEDPTEASDVYSLGSTLYTCVEGQPPFGLDENSLVLLHKVARGEIIRPQRAGALEGALLAMLEPSPARRPTMAGIRDRLAQIAAGDAGNTAQILTSPLDRRTAPLPPRPPTRRIPTTTESGLPAAHGPTTVGRAHPTSGVGESWQVTQHSRPVFSGFDQPPGKTDPPRHAALAAAVFLAFVVLAAIAVTLIALLR
ncbi:serine/threonine-protein kinase [Williamsia muralis]|uniref:non-specific serine/threonine protein kinase n=1 Tax=Williamsia marianensis TaxID=85044 RepID=A0A2G3PSJ9_WILMA|nr:serine/threonine-protein kinase [Williamsia marianensis]PHV68784.1 serine/threonine protein kinase [Williamsia marianensis]